MFADSARIVESNLSPDATERMLPGSAYTRECFQRIQEDRAGYAHYVPALLARDSTTHWLRDLHSSDTLVDEISAAKRIWLLRREAGADTLAPVLIPLDVDSLRRAWHGASAPTSQAAAHRRDN
jgi:hypothetical protein